ncbi:hypothetical protein HK101_000332, partial [Irineochytrium annulatum]
MSIANPAARSPRRHQFDRQGHHSHRSDPPPRSRDAPATVVSKELKEPAVELRGPTVELIPTLRRLNSVLFPIPYNDKFYNCVMQSPDLSSL